MPALGGVICANFGYERGLGLKKCERGWHGKCYVQHERDKFPVLSAKDIDDSLVDDSDMVDEDPMRFKEGRDGDHLLCTFQCDWCHFQNLKRRDVLEANRFDELTMLCIRRGILDSFWGRERSTVYSNWREGVRYLGYCKSMGIEEEAYPRRGPFPVRDTAGMKIACAILLRSMEPGRNSSTVQYETMRKLRSHLSNFAHTCPGGVGASFMSEEGGAGMISNSPTNAEWFRRFMKGCHRRMGDVWMPDRPITIHELKAVLEFMEADWVTFEGDVQGQYNTAMTACMFVAGFFAALRGEELVRVDIGAMRKHWCEAVNFTPATHVPLMLSGRFKREIGEKLFCQPLAPVTKSGVNIVQWFFRMLEVAKKGGIISGPLFLGRKGKRATTADLDTRFHAALERVQKKYPNLLPHEVKVSEEYSVFRSLRRGATAEAQNARVPKEVIEANNRWRKHARSRGITPGMSMMERYTDAKASVPALVRFSKEM